MKLWAVTVEFELVVVADTRDEAERVAQSAVKDCDDVAQVHASELLPFDALPYGWDEKCIPYGGHGKKTIREELDSDGTL